MSRIRRIDAPGYPRHLGIRGVDGMACFCSDKDRHVFLNYLREAIEKGGCSLHAFVLMTNHVHLLATPSEAGAVPAMMHSVGTRYARFFNAARERTGPVFEGRYWASLIETECYFLETMRYIELNPVRAGMVDLPDRYPWSSHLHNIGREMRPELAFHGEYLGLGQTPLARAQAWAAFVERGIADEDLVRLRKQLRRGRPLGSNAFVDRFAPPSLNPVRVPGS